MHGMRRNPSLLELRQQIIQSGHWKLAHGMAGILAGSQFSGGGAHVLFDIIWCHYWCLAERSIHTPS